MSHHRQKEEAPLATVKIYSKDYCPFCDRAKALMKAKGQQFEEIKINTGSDDFMKLAQSTGMKTVPQIFIDDQFIGGFSELSALDQKGGLDPLLKK